MSTPQEQEAQKVRADLQALGRHIDHQLPYGWGFVVLAFPFGAGGRMNYIANAERADVVRSMYEFIEATREKWSEHTGEAGSGADDEQLARARQELSELRRLLTRAADALGSTRPDINAALPIISKWWLLTQPLIAELRKAAQ
jgi:hypothetical protein